MSSHKQVICQAALEKVHAHGWTQDAITAAVMERGLSISMSGLVTPSQLVNYCMDDWNNQLKLHLQEFDDSSNNNNNNNTFEAAAAAMKWRLSKVIPFVQSGRWHEGMAMGLQSPLTTQAQLHRIIELVAPSASLAQQAGLGAIYGATELHLLADTSPDYEETWKFLQNRLNELDALMSGSISGSSSSSSTYLASLPVAATSAVAFSLLEGVASLLMPPTTNTLAGTKPSDYVAQKSKN
jgi:ubiquinone biosynthesis protein COQ9